MERVPEELQRARARWRFVGRERPAFAEAPGPGQESVWDYPRPPRIERERRVARVEFAGRVVAESSRALRVLETASPPTLYLPRQDVDLGCLVESQTQAVCEWKGNARHYGLRVAGAESPDAAWDYPDPFPEFAALAGRLAFLPARVGACSLGGEPVRPQPGDYYGGWWTKEIVGPVKGGPGSADW